MDVENDVCPVRIIEKKRWKWYNHIKGNSNDKQLSRVGQEKEEGHVQRDEVDVAIGKRLEDRWRE